MLSELATDDLNFINLLKYMLSSHKDFLMVVSFQLSAYGVLTMHFLHMST